MNSIKLLILLIISSCLFSLCSYSKQTIKDKTSSGGLKDTFLQNKWYLSNRLNNFEKEILFMDSLIVPKFTESGDWAFQKSYTRGEFNIKDVKKNLWQKKDFLFFLNLDCFLGQRAEVPIKIFCTDSTWMSLIKSDSIFIENQKSWKLVLLNYENSIGITFTFESGVVKNVSAWNPISQNF